LLTHVWLSYCGIYPESQNCEASKDSCFLGIALQATAIAGQWLSSDQVVTPTDTNATIEDKIFYTVCAGAI
jgi:hypothetical protein